MIETILLKPKSTILRLDVLPFLIIYVILFLMIFTLDEEMEDFIYIKFGFIINVFLNCLVYLIGNWNKKYSKTIHYDVEKDIEFAKYIYIKKKMKDGADNEEICELLNKNIEGEIKYIFYFYKSKYCYDSNKKRFSKISYEIQNNVSDFINNEIKITNKKFIEDNVLDFPLPDFKLMFREQIMDPLNFFQFFTVCLYFFDEEFYHPLMTLVMLIFSNVMIVIDRMTTTMSVRNLRIKPQEIYKYENNIWKKTNTNKLYPGDFISIKPSCNIKELDDNSLDKDIEKIRNSIPFGNKLPVQLWDKIRKMGEGESKPVIPCDLIILNGNVLVDESILTGESVPISKNSIRLENEKLDPKNKNKNNILFSGTEILTIDSINNNYGNVPPSPDGGCLCMVYKTGFETSKGKLAKSILRNSDSQVFRNKESYVLLLVLLILSVVSSIYVLLKGLEDEDRDKNKLFVRCILIIVNIIPAELPMIISFAINSSLMYLRNKKIFCSEPYRIALCGKVKYMAFDKTGTLTSDKLSIEGFYFNDNTFSKGVDEKNFTKIILGGCHSIVEYKKNILGDPIELLFFENSSFKYNYSIKTAYNSKKSAEKIKILKIFEFNSDLKRMSAIVKIEGFSTEFNGYYIVTKGAPDVLDKFLVNKPDWYENKQKEFSKKGFRLLTLAYKKLESNPKIKDSMREEYEKDLNFDSFYILTSKLKHDTNLYLNRFKNANYEIKMITGDSIYTAIQTFIDLKINSKKPLYIIEDNLYNYDDIKVNNLVDMIDLNEYFLCIDGTNLNYLLKNEKFSKELAKNISVYARVSPKHKEIIINKIKNDSELVLMCGDGSNDVGALKCSDVGIALIGIKEEKTKQEKTEIKNKQKELKLDLLKKGKPMKDIANEMNNLFGDNNLTFKAGDACVAAPFTNKHTNSIKCVDIIMKQGNCTLSTSMQNLKIITLNSFLNAYIMSSLHLNSLKFSDYQNTILGIYGLYFYYLLSFSKPSKRLPKEKPLSSIYNKYFLISLILQIIINFIFLVLMQNLSNIDYVEENLDNQRIDLETDDTVFKPNFKVSVMFLYLLSSNFCISIFNHEGQPFMLSISDNKNHKKLVLIPILVITALIFDLSTDLNYIFQTTFKTKDEEMNMKLFIIIAVYIVVNYLLNLGTKLLRFGRIPSYL